MGKCGSCERCPKLAIRGGVCVGHGAKVKRCCHEGCTSRARNGGLCMRHGAKGKHCSHTGCSSRVRNGGLCMRHGAKVKRCCHERCTSLVQNGGLCIRHGAKVKRCSHEGCASHAKKGGVCKSHGAMVKRCGHEGCAKNPSMGGFSSRRGEKLTTKVHCLGGPSKHHQKVRGRYGVKSFVAAVPIDGAECIPQPAEGSKVTVAASGAMRISCATARPSPSLLTSTIALNDFDDDEICAWIWRSSRMRTATNGAGI